MSVTCPKCGARAAGTGSVHKAYCRACGWNKSIAAAALRSDMQASVGAGVVGVILVLLALRGPGGPTGALLLGTGFILCPLSFALLAWFRLGRVRSATTAASQPREMCISFTEAAIGDRNLLTGTPRTVRLSWRGWLYCIGVACLFVALLAILRVIAAGIREISSHPLKSAFVGLVYGWCLVLCLRFFGNRFGERQLLLQGKFTKGTVIQTNTRSNSLPQIEYVFQDAGGRAFRKRATDFSLKLYEEMSVSVFYDEGDPGRSMALEASVFLLR